MHPYTSHTLKHLTLIAEAVVAAALVILDPAEGPGSADLVL